MELASEHDLVLGNINCAMNTDCLNARMTAPPSSLGISLVMRLLPTPDSDGFATAGPPVSRHGAGLVAIDPKFPLHRDVATVARNAPYFAALVTSSWIELLPLSPLR